MSGTVESRNIYRVWPRGKVEQTVCGSFAERLAGCLRMHGMTHCCSISTDCSQKIS